MTHPLPQVPQGLLTRASVGQQIQDWVKEARDALEFFNDQQAHFSALLANQLAQIQFEAELAHRAQMIAQWQEEHSFILEHMDDIKAGAFMLSAMARTFILPFEGAFMLGYAGGLYGGWGWSNVFGWLGFDTRAEVMWSEEQLEGLWESAKGMWNDYTTAEGWSKWANEMSLLYDSADPMDAAMAGWMFGDRTGTIALTAYGGARGGTGAYRRVKAKSAPPSMSSSGGSAPYVPRSKGLGEKVSIADLLKSDNVPGTKGVTVADHHVIFTDLWKLTQKHGVEFALTREGGKFRLYSGVKDKIKMPYTAERIIAHTHPDGTPRPSSVDFKFLNKNWYWRAAYHSGTAVPKPSRVIWGPGRSDFTPFKATRCALD